VERVRVSKMKEKILYTCEICHTDYSDKKKAEECEKGHLKPKIIQSRYNKIVAGGEYPSMIIVDFEDGTRALYRRDGRL
jgi:hypothetical protein